MDNELFELDQELQGMHLAGLDSKDLQNALDEAVDTASSLQQIHSALGQSLAEGGLSGIEATALRVSIEHLTARLGFAPKIFPALEHFEQPEKRVVVTKIAMEGLGKVLLRIWETILETMQKVAGMVGRFVRGLDNTANALRSKAEALKARAKELSGAEPGAHSLIPAQTLATVSWPRMLQVKDRFAEGRSFLGKFAEHERILAELNRAENTLAVKGQSVLQKAMQSILDTEALHAATDEAMVLFAQTVPGHVLSRSDYAQEGLRVHTQPLAFGNVSYYCIVFTDSVPGALHASKFRRFIATSEEAPRYEPLRKGVIPLGANDVASLCDAIVKDVAQLEKSQELHSTVQEAVADAQRELKAVVRKAGANTNVPLNSNSTKLHALSQLYMRSVFQGLVALRKYEVAIMRAALDYGSASLRVLEHPNR